MTLQNESLKPSFFSQSVLVRIFILIQLCLIAYQFTPDLSTNGDDARYYLLGKALHDGKGFHQIQHPTLPMEKTYPIVFPAFLAFVHIFSGSILLAKISVALLGALVTLLSFYLFKYFSSNLLIPMTMLVAAAATLAQYNSSLMSEVPYLFFSLLALYLFERSVRDPKSKWLFWLTIAFSIFPMHCRSVGLAFSASWILTTLLTKRYRYMFAHIALLLASNIAFHLCTSWDNSYLIQIIQRNTYNPDLGFVTAGEMIQRIGQNIHLYSTSILQRSIAPIAFNNANGLQLIVAAFCLVFVFIGWIRSLFGTMRFLSLYVFMYFGILLMWQTEWSSERFVAGILPFLYFFLLFGIEACFSFVNTKSTKGMFDRIKKAALPNSNTGGFGKWAIWGVTGAFLIINIVFQLTALRSTQELGPDWKNYYSCADWLRVNTPPSTITMSRKVELFYVRSNRTGVMYPYSHDVNKIMKVIDDSKVEYVVYDNFFWTGTTRQYLYPVIQSFPQRFQLVYALNNPPTAIYKVVQ